MGRGQPPLPQVLPAIHESKSPSKRGDSQLVSPVLALVFTRVNAGKPLLRVLGALVVALLVVVSGCSPGLIIPRNGILGDVYVRGPANRPVVALTFDDGPNGRCTEETLDALAAMQAPATFFLLGANLGDGHDDALLARMYHEGHRIGLHGWGHGLRHVSLEFAEHDLHRGIDSLSAAVARAGLPPDAVARLYRPPFGVVTGPLASATRKAGLAIILWTISVEDWREGVAPETVVMRILELVGPGDVIVLHDGLTDGKRSRDSCVDGTNAAAVIRRLIPALRDRGLEPALLEDVLGM
jgi:peptidoglycan/xylan/chitin deacetylase (PgdA/CDA1 family)